MITHLWISDMIVIFINMALSSSFKVYYNIYREEQRKIPFRLRWNALFTSIECFLKISSSYKGFKSIKTLISGNTQRSSYSSKMELKGRGEEQRDHSTSFSSLFFHHAVIHLVIQSSLMIWGVQNCPSIFRMIVLISFFPDCRGCAYQSRFQ